MEVHMNLRSKFLLLLLLSTYACIDTTTNLVVYLFEAFFKYGIFLIIISSIMIYFLYQYVKDIIYEYREKHETNKKRRIKHTSSNDTCERSSKTI